MFPGREQGSGPRPQEGGNNGTDFIQAVRSRKASEVNATLKDGTISCSVVHLATISYRLGRTVHFDAEDFQCVGDEEANRMFARDYRMPFAAREIA